ncbi:MAG: hypothetical protein Q8L86_12870 [Vicinamibacterales bacterium]|nr:hypothetical protein [Vicinamibacterales bacterium]
MVRTVSIACFAAALLLLTVPASAQDFGDNRTAVPAYLLARATMANETLTAKSAASVTDAAVTPDVASALQWPTPASPEAFAGTAGRPAALPVLYGALVLLQGMDFHTTRQGMALGAHETNGLIRNGNAGTTTALKMASAATTIFIAEKMWKKNRAGALALMVATNVVLGAVVANNANVIRQLQ